MLRIVFLITWLLYIQFSLHTLLPYVIALAYAGSGDFGWLQDAGYLLAAASILAISVHLHVVLIRLILLRVRVFGQA
jgi:hypothetical protein